jgi:hypothetical protein
MHRIGLYVHRLIPSYPKDHWSLKSLVSLLLSDSNRILNHMILSRLVGCGNYSSHEGCSAWDLTRLAWGRAVDTVLQLLVAKNRQYSNSIEFYISPKVLPVCGLLQLLAGGGILGSHLDE